MWGPEDWDVIIGMMCTGVGISESDWGHLRYVPAIWSEGGITRTKPTGAQWHATKSLAGRALINEPMVAIARAQLAFHSEDVLVNKTRKA